MICPGPYSKQMIMLLLSVVEAVSQGVSGTTSVEKRRQPKEWSISSVSVAILTSMVKSLGKSLMDCPSRNFTVPGGLTLSKLFLSYNTAPVGLERI